MPDIDYWLGRKYSIMQQGADATTQSAASGAITAAAGANVDNTRARLMPGESMANILAQRAQANLVNQQASVVRPVAMAGIANTNANTGFTGMQTQALYKDAVQERSIAPDSLRRVLGGGGLPSIGGGTGALPARRIGESQAAYLDRINGI